MLALGASEVGLGAAALAPLPGGSSRLPCEAISSAKALQTLHIYLAKDVNRTSIGHQYN